MNLKNKPPAGNPSHGGHPGHPIRPAGPQLNAAQLALLEAVSAGNTNRQIAQLLGRSEQTVRNQLHTLYKKVGAINRAQAAAWWTQAKARRKQEPQAPQPPAPHPQRRINDHAQFTRRKTDGPG